MTTTQRVFLFFLLPTIAMLSYPPAVLISGAGVLVIAIGLLVTLGFLMSRGRLLALTFSIFLQGLNVIIRVMMFWSNGFSNQGIPNYPFLITSLLGLFLSLWLLMRLDQQDIRNRMYR